MSSALKTSILLALAMLVVGVLFIRGGWLPEIAWGLAPAVAILVLMLLLFRWGGWLLPVIAILVMWKVLNWDLWRAVLVAAPAIIVALIVGLIWASARGMARWRAQREREAAIRAARPDAVYEEIPSTYRARRRNWFGQPAMREAYAGGPATFADDRAYADPRAQFAETRDPWISDTPRPSWSRHARAALIAVVGGLIVVVLAVMGARLISPNNGELATQAPKREMAPVGVLRAEIAGETPPVETTATPLR